VIATILPEAIQQQGREGKILTQVALKFLVPVVRQRLEDCQRMAAIFAQHHSVTREAGQLFGAWRKGSRVPGPSEMPQSDRQSRGCKVDRVEQLNCRATHECSAKLRQARRGRG